jgi:hypothetical protein
LNPTSARATLGYGFSTRAEGMTSFLTDSENTAFEQSVIRMKFEGAGVPRRFEGLDKVASVSN